MDKERLVTELILFAVKRLTPFDFSQYALPTMQKRLLSYVRQSPYKNLEVMLLDLIEGNQDLASDLIQTLTVTYSRFFRDAAYFSLVCDHILPILDAYPKIKIWCIGCSSGEEVYSYAMLLKLLGLLPRSIILGTDINKKILGKAKKASYSIENLNAMQTAFKQLKLPNVYSIVDLLDFDEKNFSISPDVKQYCHFTDHNLLTNASLGQMQMVSCRNVLIYLSQKEQDRIVRDLIVPSIVKGGFAIFGEAENQHRISKSLGLEQLQRGLNIYQRNA